MDGAQSARIGELIDRHDIYQVLLRYARGLDRLDVELARSCYFDDCTEDHSNFVGSPDDFIVWANAIALGYESTQHAILNHFCDLQGDDAYCETYFHFTAVASAPPHFMSVGRYVDHFQRRNEEWRIANRVTIVEGRFDIADFARAHLFAPAYGEGEKCPATRGADDVSYHRPLSIGVQSAPPSASKKDPSHDRTGRARGAMGSAARPPCPVPDWLMKGWAGSAPSLVKKRA